MLLEVMSGADDFDSTVSERPVPAYTASLEWQGKAKIGYIRSAVENEAIAPEIRRQTSDVLNRLRAEGHEVVGIDMPLLDSLLPTYYILTTAEASSNLSRFDGVRYGFRAEDYANLDDMYMKSRAQGFGAEVKRRILIGTYVLSHGYYDAYYLQAQRIRRLIANDFVEAFKSCDVIMGPTSPSTAFKLGEKAADPVQMYLSDIYTIAVNLAGLPGMSVPCGFVGGLPVGLQLIGNYFAEAQLLNVAHRYQQATDWHQRRPAGLE